MPPERGRERSRLPSSPPQPYPPPPPPTNPSPSTSSAFTPSPSSASSPNPTYTDESHASIPASHTSKPKTSNAALLLKCDREHIWCRRSELGDATVLCSYGVDFSNETTLFRKEFADVERNFQGMVYWKSMVEREMDEDEIQLMKEEK